MLRWSHRSFRLALWALCIWAHHAVMAPCRNGARPPIVHFGTKHLSSFALSVARRRLGPPTAVQILTRYITGAVPAAEFQRWCRADSTRRASGQTPVEAS